MGYPMILYGLAPLVNPSFETDDDGDAPTGWDTSSSVNADQEVVDDVYQSAGHGFPSRRSLRQNVDDATSGNKAVAVQRFQISEVLEILLDDGGEFAAAASFKAGASAAMQNASINLAQYQGGTSTIGSGTLLTPPSSRSWSTAGPTWFLKLIAQEPHASVEWIEISLLYELNDGFDSVASAWWDRVFCGGLVELHKGARQWRPRPDLGHAINEGGGDAAIEIVKVRPVRTQLDVQVVNLLEGSEDELALRRFNRWLEGEGVGTLALWGDRDKLTNAERHYQKLVHDPRLRLDYPRGITRRNYSFRFIATSEGTG